MARAEIQYPASETQPSPVPPTSLTDDLAESLVVFTLGERSFTVGDVLRAAEFRRELDPVRRALARQTAAEKGGAEAPDLPKAMVLAEQFRYERDLITAEETEQWLAKRGLTIGDFEAFFVRQTCGAAVVGTEADPAELLAHLHFSGEFDRLATALAWRVAAAQTAPFAADELAQMEAAFQQIRRDVVTPGRCAQLLLTLRLPLTRLLIESLTLPGRDPAQEAFLCATQDGVALRDLAEAAGQPHCEEELYLEQLPEEWQPRFLAAPAGRVLPPLERDDAFVLHRILRKTEPSLADPAIRARVEDRLLSQHFENLCGQSVRWAIRPQA